MKLTLASASTLFGLVVLCAPPARAGATVTEPAVVHETHPAVSAAEDSALGLEKRTFSGPRVGFTVAPDNGPAYETLQEHGMGRVISQFGWHFERQIVPTEGGPELLTEFVPLVGGVEYGKLIPTLTFALGVRMPSGLEFGVGPSFTLVNAEGKASSSLMLAVGHSFAYSTVHIPLNLVVTANKDGTRITMLVGFAIPQRRR
jgi:hypothetical protein